ncbi:hypothetical protein AAHB37_14450 [Glutamicibacter halophytocola]|uniref:magnesium transporter MgtE N-terminal domain-containing protein n=1 Tax=Glutamicibacter halophytocola TaxID=1933880 RepID=UPI003219DC89
MFTFEYVDFSTTSQEIRTCLAADAYQRLAALLRELELGQLIEQFEALKTTDAAILYRMLDKERSLEVFQELDAPVQAELIETLQEESVVEAFAALEPADRVAPLDELPATVATQLLAGLDARRPPSDRGAAGLPGFKRRAGHVGPLPLHASGAHRRADPGSNYPSTGHYGTLPHHHGG